MGVVAPFRKLWQTTEGINYQDKNTNRQKKLRFIETSDTSLLSERLVAHFVAKIYSKLYAAKLPVADFEPFKLRL